MSKVTIPKVNILDLSPNIQFVGRLEEEVAFEDGDGGAGHEDGVGCSVVADDYVAAAHGYGTFFVGEAVEVGGVGAGTGTRAAGKGLAGASLPDAEGDVFAVEDADEFDIGTLREYFVTFIQRSDLFKSMRNGNLSLHTVGTEQCRVTDAVRVRKKIIGIEDICYSMGVTHGYVCELTAVAGNAKYLMADIRR